MMNNVPRNFNFYKYKIDVTSIIIADKVEVIYPEQLGNVGIEKDFENDLFPILKIELTMTDDMYYRMIDHKDNVKIKVRLLRYKLDVDTNEVTSKIQIFSDIFSTVIDIDSPNIGREFNKDVDDTTSRMFNKGMELYLFKLDTMEKSKSLVNLITKDCSMLDVFSYIMAMNKVNNILMENPDNVEIYKQIIIPCQTMMSSISYLDSNYGFYKDGALLFFDIDRTYMLSKRTRGVYGNNEYKEVLFSVLNSSSASSKTSGSYLNSETKTININIEPSAISFTNSNVIRDQIEGNKLMLIDPSNDNIDIIYPDSKFVQGGLKLGIVTSNSKYIDTRYKARSKESELICSLMVTNIDISALTPNKIIKLIFEDSKLNKSHGGQYRLTSYSTMFSKEDKMYKITTQCNLMKVL